MGIFPGTSGRHAGGTGCVNVGLSVWRSHDGMRPLEHEGHPVLPRELGSRTDPVPLQLGRRDPQQPRHLPGMRGQHHRLQTVPAAWLPDD